MAGHLDGELVLKLAQVFLPPAVADQLFALDAQVRPLCGDGRFRFAAIEQPDGLRAVFEVSGPDLQAAQLGDAKSGAAQWVLVDVDDLVVAKEVQGEVVQCIMSPLNISGAATSDQRVTWVYCSLGVSVVGVPPCQFE